MANIADGVIEISSGEDVDLTSGDDSHHSTSSDDNSGGDYMDDTSSRDDSDHNCGGDYMEDDTSTDYKNSDDEHDPILAIRGTHEQGDANFERHIVYGNDVDLTEYFSKDYSQDFLKYYVRGEIHLPETNEFYHGSHKVHFAMGKKDGCVIMTSNWIKVVKGAKMVEGQMAVFSF